MAILQCRHCGHAIESSTRSTQCYECRALFPFACAVCARNLRAPFLTCADERHLTPGDPPLPLCEDHFLRRCPDCGAWFGSDENPGFFRCPSCAKSETTARFELGDILENGQKLRVPKSRPDSKIPQLKTPRGGPLVAGGRAAFDANPVAISAAGCAFLALIGWLLFAR